MAVSKELAGELKAVLARLREVRDASPKHGAQDGPPDCGNDCVICFTEHHFNYLIDQIPRPASILGEVLSQIESGVQVAPSLGVQFLAPWTLTQEPE